VVVKCGMLLESENVDCVDGEVSRKTFVSPKSAKWLCRSRSFVGIAKSRS
jgi:hypothetical protein